MCPRHQPRASSLLGMLASFSVVILREDVFLLWPLENNGRLDFLVLTKETSLGELGVLR